MNTVLYIQASPRAELSYSIRIANAFVYKYKQTHPDDKIVTLNVFDEPLPEFSGFAIEAKYAIMHGKEHSQQQKKAWEKIEQVIEQFKSADNTNCI